MVQNKEANATLAKTKNELDKALKQVGELTKKVRSMQTAEENEAEAKKEAQEKHNEYVKGLEYKINLAEAKERYSAIVGMDAELVTATAKAELDGDMDTVTANIKKANEAAIKAKQAEWLRNRPVPQGGNGDGEEKDEFLEGFNS